jgi:hypothetical protein
MIIRYFPQDVEMVPFAPVIIDNTSVFIFHMYCIYIDMSLYFRNF